jgi:hypothetical protein
MLPRIKHYEENYEDTKTLVHFAEVEAGKQLVQHEIQRPLYLDMVTSLEKFRRTSKDLFANAWRCKDYYDKSGISEMAMDPGLRRQNEMARAAKDSETTKTEQENLIPAATLLGGGVSAFLEIGGKSKSHIGSGGSHHNVAENVTLWGNAYTAPKAFSRSSQSSSFLAQGEDRAEDSRGHRRSRTNANFGTIPRKSGIMSNTKTSFTKTSFLFPSFRSSKAAEGKEATENAIKQLQAEQRLDMKDPDYSKHQEIDPNGCDAAMKVDPVKVEFGRECDYKIPYGG